MTHSNYMIQICVPNKFLLKTQCHSFTYKLSVIVTETVSPTKPKIDTICPFTEKVCLPCPIFF